MEARGVLTKGRDMSGIRLGEPVWCNGKPVLNLRYVEHDLRYPLEGEINGCKWHWTKEGIYDIHRPGGIYDLTHTPPVVSKAIDEPESNTPPAGQLRETPEAQPDLTAENTALKAKVAELEVLLRQSYKENSEAWKVAVKWQRVAAKGIQR